MNPLSWAHRALIYSLFAIGIVAFAFLFGGCASVVSTISDGHPNRDKIPVVPGSKAVMMTGTYEDTDRDGWLDNIPRGAGVFRGNNGVMVKDDETVGYIWSRPNLFLLGNVIYGGIPGVLVDTAGGGAWELYSFPGKTESTSQRLK